MSEREIDPALRLVPRDQYERIMDYAIGDIGPEFLGFTEMYLALAKIIPKFWTVVDLGCAYAPQAFIFKNHKAYIGVDLHDQERFTAPNTTHHIMSAGAFIDQHLSALDQESTFAICSYVPPWGESVGELTRRSFSNLFVYYPARDPAWQKASASLSKFIHQSKARPARAAGVPVLEVKG